MAHPSHKLLTPQECVAEDRRSWQHESGTCPICDGGLAYCTVCKGGESELDTPCPGDRAQKGLPSVANEETDHRPTPDRPS